MVRRHLAEGSCPIFRGALELTGKAARLGRGRWYATFTAKSLRS